MKLWGYACRIAGLSGGDAFLFRPQTRSRPATTEGCEPAYRIKSRRSVERECNKLCPATDIFPRDSAIKSKWTCYPAIGRQIAIVTQQVNMIFGNDDGRYIVRRLWTQIDNVIAHAIRQGFPQDRELAKALSAFSGHPQSGEFAALARGVGINRQHEVRLDFLFDRRAIQEHLTSPQFQHISRQTNDAFDVIAALIFGR